MSFKVLCRDISSAIHTGSCVCALLGRFSIHYFQSVMRTPELHTGHTEHFMLGFADHCFTVWFSHKVRTATTGLVATIIRCFERGYWHSVFRTRSRSSCSFTALSCQRSDNLRDDSGNRRVLWTVFRRLLSGFNGAVRNLVLLVGLDNFGDALVGSITIITNTPR